MSKTLKKTYKYGKIDLWMFNACVKVYWDDDWYRIIEGWPENDFPEAVCRIHDDTSEGLNVELFFKKKASAGTIAHECFHAVVHILNYIGSSLSSESEEVYAYLLGSLTKSCLGMQNDINNPKKKKKRSKKPK